MKRTIILSLAMLSLVSTAVVAKEDNVMDSRKDAEVSSQKSEKNHVQLDAIQIIKDDHEHIRQMIAQLTTSMDANNVEESRSNFKKLKSFLEKHETMEQKLWYPELEKKKDLESLIKDLKKEEDDAGKNLKNIASIKDNDKWMSEVKKLVKDVENHAKEEEDKLFPKVSDALDKAELDKIAVKLEKYKKKNKISD